MTFPKLPIQWSENGYEITEELGHGSYGSVYKLVKDKGTENEEVSALKIINWTLDNNTVRYEFTKDWDEARKKLRAAIRPDDTRSESIRIICGNEDDCAVERKLYGKNAGVKLLEALYPDGISERSDGFCRRM